jgi:UDP-N-acetylmuramyl pentapeptide phosphotransferase/UDP-N-acetylglucosamine-1-phosphate transferase
LAEREEGWCEFHVGGIPAKILARPRPDRYNPAMWWLVFAFLGAAALTWGLTRPVLAQLRRRAILDHPNQRSSHDRPTPRGGGIAVALVVAACWLPAALASPVTAILLAAGLVLAALSWLDDLRNLGIATRLAAQFTAVAAGLYAFGGDGLLCQGILPLWLDRIVAALAWVWFVNLFNFMDGIDGIAAVETMVIGCGLAGLGAAAAATPSDIWLPLALAAAATGFLFWNWHPAKLFLGDVGSVPLGYWLGGLLVLAAMKGAWAAATILPLYYLADATLTLCRRALKGEKFWQAHRSHFYQRAVQVGKSHAAVSLAVGLTGIVLIGCAFAAQAGAVLGSLAGAGTAVAALMIWMAR